MIKELTAQGPREGEVGKRRYAVGKWGSADEQKN